MRISVSVSRGPSAGGDTLILGDNKMMCEVFLTPYVRGIRLIIFLRSAGFLSNSIWLIYDRLRPKRNPTLVRRCVRRSRSGPIIACEYFKIA